MVAEEGYPVSTAFSHHHYNPDWQDDESSIANFVARLDLFEFLRSELIRAPREGSVQHYLLVGVRGMGKTTLLKRLSVAIRRDEDLKDHLIALSFPEELYQVKNLDDFWWAACEALADALDRIEKTDLADRLSSLLDRKGNAESREGFKLLLHTCAELGLRPVLLVDNLDLVFNRIDKAGRKLKDPHSPAYWELREALSTTTSPIVIGGSVRLSEPFTDYDKAFYDFFIPKRLGKLSLEEVRQVLDRLAVAQDVPEVKERLRERPGRIDSLYELTGGNPRALGLIFELLRNGPNSRAVEDFERLMDLTTPYYKARFEDLSEQAQVVMHALAVRRPEDGLRFGHTAAELGSHAGLPTGTVSTQLDILEREGLVEKTAAHGRMQYRIAEQLFRLWLQMRSTRRIRQNVIGLAEFLEALFDFEELASGLQEKNGAAPLLEARLAFAVAGTDSAASFRRGLEAHGADRLLEHLGMQGGEIDDYLLPGDISEDINALMHMKEKLQKCGGGGLSKEEQEALLGSLTWDQEQKQSSVDALCDKNSAQQEAVRVRKHLEVERKKLSRFGLKETDLPILYKKRSLGRLPLPWLTVQDVESACLNKDKSAFNAMVWRLLGTRDFVKFADESNARDWLEWGMEHAMDAASKEWANVAGTMRRSKMFSQAKEALDRAFELGDSSRAWYERAVLLTDSGGDFSEAEAAFRKAIELDPNDTSAWTNLGFLLAEKLSRYEEAEAAYLKAIELDPNFSLPWNNLGNLFAKLSRFDEAEAAYRKAIELGPNFSLPWNNLGLLFEDKLSRFEEAEAAYRKSIELDPQNGKAWGNLGILLDKFNRLEEALTAFDRAAKLDMHPYWKRRRDELLVRVCVKSVESALDSADEETLRKALDRLLAESDDIATSLVSREFVEDFLAKVLPDLKKAEMLVAMMRKLGYEKHARPMLLAFEAAMTERLDMLDELEPEVQGAAKVIYRRLSDVM